MEKRLSKKEKGFIKDYIKTNNGVQSALKNYDTDDYSTAGVIAHENLKRPKIQNAIQEALPDELLARVHLEGLQATKRSGTGGMKINIGTDGKVNDFGHTDIDEPDFAVRHKYLDSAYKVKGTYAPEKKDVKVEDSTATSEAVRELAQKLNDLHRGGSITSNGVVANTMDSKA